MYTIIDYLLNARKLPAFMCRSDIYSNTERCSEVEPQTKQPNAQSNNLLFYKEQYVTNVQLQCNFACQIRGVSGRKFCGNIVLEKPIDLH